MSLGLASRTEENVSVFSLPSCENCKESKDSGSDPVMVS